MDCAYGVMYVKTRYQTQGLINDLRLYNRNRWGNSVRLYFWGGSKITADDDCSHEIKRCLLLGRKGMTDLDSILKSRDITLPTKLCPVKAIFSSSHGCDSHLWM